MSVILQYYLLCKPKCPQGLMCSWVLRKGQRGKGQELGTRNSWAPALASPDISCVVSGKPLDLPVPQISYITI